MKIKELKPQKNPRLPDEADSEVWQEAVKGVRKIKNPNLDLSKPAPKEFIIRENVNVFEAYGGEDLSFLIPGAADNIDANTMRRFKRGEFAIEAVLDLHGCTSEESFGKVENFIKKAYLAAKTLCSDCDRKRPASGRRHICRPRRFAGFGPPMAE